MPLPVRRYYANNAAQQTLAVGVNSSATTITIGGTYATWPNTFPFYATIDIGTATSEIVKVTAISGVNATVVRGQNGTSAVSHSAGADFRPTVIALDYDEANAHTTSTAGVHGISGHVVGDDDAQTLSNKTLDGSTILQDPTINGTATVVNVHVTGDSTVDGTMVVTGTSTFTGDVTTGHKLNVTTDATVSGKLTVGGSTTLNGTLTVGDVITDKRSNPVAGNSSAGYTNANSNTVTVAGSFATRVVGNTWDTTDSATKGDINVTQRGVDGSMKIVTPGRYFWEISTSIPDNPGQRFVQGLVLNGATTVSGTRDVRPADGGGTLTSSGTVIFAANDKVQVGYEVSSSASQTVTPIRFTLSLLSPSN